MSLPSRVAGELALVLAALAIGLAFGSLVALWFKAPPADVLATMLTSWRVLPDLVAEDTAILTLTALAFAIPLHAGLFNIGAEGGVILGALASLWVAVKTGSLPLALLAGALVGGALSTLAGALRVYLGVNEVLSTIMLNWTVYWVSLYTIITRLTDPYLPQVTVEVPAGARLGWLNLAGTMVPSTILVSLAIAGLAWVSLRMTRPGLILRATGANEEAARMRGVPVRRYRLTAMLTAGILAGLAGALHIVGFAHRIDVTGGTVTNYGFNGIGVALIGRNDPLGVVAAAFLLSTLMAGSQAVEPIYGIPKEAADVIIGVTVVALSAPTAFRLVAGKLRRGG